MTKYFLSKSVLLVIFLMPLLVFSGIAESASQTTTKPASTLLISVQEALKAKRNNFRAIFVDVRGEESFARIRIPGSINIPLHFIKTKSYLKNMYVILVGDGYVNSPLMSQAESLSTKGVETVVLAGGLAAWSQQDQKLISSGYVDHNSLYTVKPALISAAEFSRYIDISPGKNDMELLSFPGVEYVPVTSSDDLTALVELIDRPSQSPLASVLIFNRDGDYGLVKKLADKCQATVFFLGQGSDAYVIATQQQQAILAPKAQRMKTIGGCDKCPPVQKNIDEK